MKVVLINDSSCNPNWGDRAAAIALKKMILNCGGKIIGTISEDDLRYSNFKNAYEANEQTIRQGGVKEIIKLFIPPLVLKFNEIIRNYLNPSIGEDIIPDIWEDFERRSKQIFRNNHLYSNMLREFEQSDVIVIHGNGCMTGNGRIPRAELFLTYIAKKHFQKHVIIVNHTADFDHPDLNKMAQQIYPLYDDVVFRDTISLERCKAFCKGRVVPDSAFMFKPILLEDWVNVSQRLTYFDVWPDTAQFNPGMPYICIGGSSIYGSIKNRENLTDGFHNLIKHLASIYSGQIVLTSSDITDQNIFRPLARYEGLPLVGLTVPVQQAVDIIGNAEIYIGGRWHPSIFALRGGTPIIPLSSKTFKMQGLVQMAGLSVPTFDALNLNREKDAIGLQIQKYLAQGEELRFQLRKWSERESEEIWNNMAYLGRLSGHIECEK